MELDRITTPGKLTGLNVEKLGKEISALGQTS